MRRSPLCLSLWDSIFILVPLNGGVPTSRASARFGRGLPSFRTFLHQDFPAIGEPVRPKASVANPQVSVDLSPAFGAVLGGNRVASLAILCRSSSCHHRDWREGIGPPVHILIKPNGDAHDVLGSVFAVAFWMYPGYCVFQGGVHFHASRVPAAGVADAQCRGR